MTPEPADVASELVIKFFRAEEWERVHVWQKTTQGLITGIAQAMATYAAAQRQEADDLVVWLNKRCGWYQGELDRVGAQLAAAERERDDWKKAHALVAHDLDIMREKRDASEAAREQARLLVESQRFRNVLGYDICDDCGERWPTHDPECWVGKLSTIFTPGAAAPNAG